MIIIALEAHSVDNIEAATNVASAAEFAGGTVVSIVPDKFGYTIFVRVGVPLDGPDREPMLKVFHEGVQQGLEKILKHKKRLK